MHRSILYIVTICKTLTSPIESNLNSQSDLEFNHPHPFLHINFVLASNLINKEASKHDYYNNDLRSKQKKSSTLLTNTNPK